MTRTTRRIKRWVHPDDSDPAPIGKIPSTDLPEPILPGLRGWQTSDGWTVVRVHYTADPERDEDWAAEFSKGYRGGRKGRDWQRELEINFGAYSGEPVYPEWPGHETIARVSYNPHLPLLRGWDFGFRNPAIIFAQLWSDDTLVILSELFPTRDKSSMPGIKTTDLAKMVISETDRLFPGAQDESETAGVRDYCDPAGNQTKETSDFSSIEHLQNFGIVPEWAVVGRKNRIEYLRVYLEGRHDRGKPKVLIHPRCELTIKALEGGYHYPEETKGGADRDMPDTSRTEQHRPYVHLMDALEYIAAVELEVPDLMAIQRKKNLEANRTGDPYEMLASPTTGDRTDFPQPDGYDQDPEIDLEDLLGIEVDLDDALRLV